jgi:hypothetical protein
VYSRKGLGGSDPQTRLVSYVVTLADPGDFPRVKAELEGMEGVDEVVAEPR